MMQKIRRKLFHALAVVTLLLVGTYPLLPPVHGALLRTPAAFGPRPITKDKAQPNLVLILVDDLKDDPQLLQRMPNLQRFLVAQGMSFTDAIVTLPSCCPSRASILTGKFAHNHGVASNSLANGGFPSFYRGGQEANTIGTTLTNIGYRTTLLGKYLNHYPKSAAGLHIPVGWSEWYAYMDGGLYDRYVLNENGQRVKYTGKVDEYSTDLYRVKALDFLTRHRAATPSRPFFILLTPFAPHYPAHPAPRHATLFANLAMSKGPAFNEVDLTDKPLWVTKLAPITPAESQAIERFYRQQLRSLQAVDELIGQLISALASQGQLNNTYILFTSDNGLHHGEHRIIYGKGTAYEEAIRVPFIIRGPGIPPGTWRNEVITLADLAPTFAELSGAAQQPTVWDGRSLVPLLSNPRTVNWRNAVFFASPNSFDLGSANNTAEAANAAALPSPEPASAGSVEDRTIDGLGDFAYATNDLIAALAPGEEELESGVALDKGGNAGSMAYHAMRTPTYKYVEYKNGDKELYDLVNDPNELNNQFKFASPTLRTLLAASLQQFRTCGGNTCRIADSTAPVVNFSLGVANGATMSDEQRALPVTSAAYQLYLPVVMAE